jgi:hypothetical protein
MVSVLGVEPEHFTSVAYLASSSIGVAVQGYQEQQEGEQQQQEGEQQQQQQEGEGQQQQQACATLWDGSPADRQQLQQQLFTLLVSCLKAIAVAGEHAAQQCDPLQHAASILQSSLSLATSLSSSSSSSSASAVWALLLSRGLVSCGQQLQEAASASSSSSSLHASSSAADTAAAGPARSSDRLSKTPNDASSDVLSDVSDPHPEVQVADAALRQHVDLLLHCLQDVASWLVQQLPLIQLPGMGSVATGAGASSSSSSSTSLLQQLMLQAEDLQQRQLRQCQAAIDSSDADLNTHAGQLGAALVSFGGALCAVLPSKHCCNHTGCTNLARLSEAELVAGKGCVCGR